MPKDYQTGRTQPPRTAPPMTYHEAHTSAKRAVRADLATAVVLWSRVVGMRAWSAQEMVRKG